MTFKVRLEDGEPQKARGKHASLSGARAHALRQERAGCDKSLCGWSLVMKERTVWSQSIQSLARLGERFGFYSMLKRGYMGLRIIEIIIIL